MNATTTLAGIPFNRIKTSDPLIAKWALTRISDLRRRNKAYADEAIRALFDEATIIAEIMVRLRYVWQREEIQEVLREVKANFMKLSTHTIIWEH